MRTLSPSDRVIAVKRARALAADALASAFAASGPEASEGDLRDLWLSGIRSKEGLLSEGWYQPPPSGVALLIGKPSSFDRLCFASLRHSESWPRYDIRLEPQSLVYAYASPIDRKTGMIGDFAVTLYGGLDHSIKRHLAVCLDITSLVAAFAEVGMEFRELYEYASRLISKAGLINQTYSLTNPEGVDIGHTIPWSYGAYSREAQLRLRTDHTDIAGRISSNRVFLNKSARFRIQPTMAFTVEPRLGKVNGCLASFHAIVAFVDGVKEICSDFHALFSMFGMYEYLPHDALARLGYAPRSR